MARASTTPNAYPIENLVRDRRRTLGDEHGHPVVGDDEPTLGLALSGGGIRSATFSLGLLRALAKNKVLRRIDYLSTVSGGGYIGSMLGRLYDKNVPGHEARGVEDGLQRDDTLLLWWLRNNGRYLLPSGGWDFLLTASGQVRSFVATQFEVMVVSMFLASVIAAPHVAAGYLVYLTRFNGPSYSLWWYPLLLALPLPLAACCAYWMMDISRKARYLITVLALLVTVASLTLGFLPATLTGPLHHPLQILGVIALMAVIAGPMASRIKTHPSTDEQRRIVWTRYLAYTFMIIGLFATAGVLDLAGWLVRDELYVVLSGNSWIKVPLGISWTAILVVLARIIAPYLSSKDQLATAGIPLKTIANIIGYLLFACLVIWWIGVFELALLPDQQGGGHGFATIVLPFLCVLALGLGVVAVTGRELQQINRSSLHYFYRSRLARAYASVGNFHNARTPRGAEPRFPISPFAHQAQEWIEETRSVTDQLNGDDVLLSNYRPDLSGGPIHLINCCINQTRDDNTGLYNADRKGENLILGPSGIEAGRLPATAAPARSLNGATLAQWVAISGAAVGTGMGSYTKPGIAVMTFLSGFRLGYWQQRLQKSPPARPTERWGRLAKYYALLREMFAFFPGTRSEFWYVSDGGHFDNTGVYALIKRRVSMIVLADCGSDPDYTFDDVENMVRKARIDFQTSIDFVESGDLKDAECPQPHLFGTPASIVPGGGDAYLVAARITYPPAPGSSTPSYGVLLIVKPRVTSTVSLDVANYADRNRVFPQQSTVNQFYSEEEWEAYCTLGLALGSELSREFLTRIYGAVLRSDIATAKTPIEPSTGPIALRAKKRQQLAKTVGKSIGAGALVTALIAGYQAWQASLPKTVDSAPTIEQKLADVDKAISTDGSYSLDVHQKMEDLVTFATQHQPITNDQRIEIANRVLAIDQLCAAALGDEDRDRCDARNYSVPLFLQRAGAKRPPWLVRYQNWPMYKWSMQDAQPAVRKRCMPQDGKPFTLYVQIYSEQQRDDVDNDLDSIRGLGIAVANIENVVLSAHREGHKAPPQGVRPRLVYGMDGVRCATALQAALAGKERFKGVSLQALPANLTGSSTSIELWIPRPASTYNKKS
jgi:hypothetical protein